MPNDPTSSDPNLRRRGWLRPLTLLRREPAPDPMAVEPTTATLPTWPFRRPPRTEPPAGRSDAQPTTTAGRVRAAPSAVPSAPATPGAAPARDFRADRAAARYAPDGASLLVDDRSLTVLTVSMSGISVRWGGERLPATGTRVEGELVPGGSIRPFAASFMVVRVEPDRRLVAGRFVALSGTAIDRLLSWLSQLDRSAAEGGSGG